MSRYGHERLAAKHPCRSLPAALCSTHLHGRVRDAEYLVDRICRRIWRWPDYIFRAIIVAMAMLAL